MCSRKRFNISLLNGQNIHVCLACKYFMPLLSDIYFYSAERVLRDDERPLEILQEWGPHQDQVKFVLRYTVIPSAMNGEYCHGRGVHCLLLFKLGYCSLLL
jgi:hypothetical protein